MHITYTSKISRFYKTGDLAFVDENGDYIFVGRTDDQVQIDGHRIELGEIEKYAKNFSKSNNCVVISFLNEIGIQQVALFIESPNSDKSKIKKELKKHLPSYMVPEIIVLVDKFPLNINGKLDKNALHNLTKE